MILTHEIMDASLNGYLELCSDAVGTTDKNRVPVTSSFQIKYATEATNLSIGSRATCRAYIWLDHVHKRVSGVDGDASASVRQFWCISIRFQCPVTLQNRVC